MAEAGQGRVRVSDVPSATYSVAWAGEIRGVEPKLGQIEDCDAEGEVCKKYASMRSIPTFELGSLTRNQIIRSSNVVATVFPGGLRLRLCNIMHDKTYKPNTFQTAS